VRLGKTKKSLVIQLVVRIVTIKPKTFKHCKSYFLSFYSFIYSSVFVSSTCIFARQATYMPQQTKAPVIKSKCCNLKYVLHFKNI
jgi:hypothetical protein